MSGIIALFSHNNTPVSVATMKSGIEFLKHRGSEQQQFWVSPLEHIGLGITPLDLNKPTRQEPPIIHCYKNLYLILDGEFYDSERLQNDLTQWGYQLPDNSSSELVLYLYNSTIKFFRVDFFNERHFSVLTGFNRFMTGLIN